METNPISLGSSLRVPCVQELAKGSPHTVPARYLRLDQDGPLISSDGSNSLPQVPIIDMETLLSEEFGELELEKMHHACQDWGFFQLINHGVKPFLVEKVKQEIQEFFNLPKEEKEKFWQPSGDLERFGNAFVVSEDQKLEWGDMFYVVTLPTHLRKPYLFPKLPSHFRDTLESYSTELKNLAMKLPCLMAKAMKMEAHDITTLFEDGWQGMRMNYYPPCPQPESVFGLTPHSDAAGLTILLQLNEIDGVQIRKDGIWIPIQPLPGAFVINIGDIMEIISNGIYPSIEHRATVNSEKERLSIATFYSPKLDREIGPAPSLVTPENPSRFGRINNKDYLKGFFSRKLDGKSYIDFLRIPNDKCKTN